MPRPVLLGLAATISAMVLAQPGSAASGESGAPDRTDRDQVKALRLTVDWLATYPEELWVGVDMPGRCRTLPGGTRTCPVAISLRAWTGGELAPWRCEAEVLLPPARSTKPARRTNARCNQLPDPA
jgi:hypothetical protein